MKSVNQIKEEAQKRINIIKGQLSGLYRMIESDEYCTDVLDQSLAIQNSLKSLDGLILEKHLRTHVADQFRSSQAKAVRELLEVFKRSRRSK